MIFYISLYLIIVILGISRVRKKNVLIISLLFIVSALRFDVGYDFLAYYAVLESSNIKDIVFLKFGPLHGLLGLYTNYIGYTQLYFIATSLFIYFFLHKTFEMLSFNYLFSILVYLSVPYLFIMSFSFVRQFTSMALVLFATKFIFDRSFVKFNIVIIIATLLHFSSVICFPIYYIYNRTINPVVLIAVYISGFFSFDLAKSFIEFFLPMYSHYVSTDHIVAGGRLFQYFLIAIFVTVLFLRSKKPNPVENFYINIFLLSAFTFNTFQPIGPTGTRLSYVYLLYMTLSIPYFLMRVKKRRRIVIVLAVSSALYCLSLISNSKVGTRSPTIPYQVFFNKTIDDIRPYGWVTEN